MNRRHKGRQTGRSLRPGFTLIQLAVLVMLLGLMSVALLPTARSKLDAMQVTNQRIAMIQNAMIGYMAANGALPCPAVGFRPLTDANFSVAANSGTACDTTNLLNSGNTFIGIVPVKTLGLPDYAALDGFGRRLTYAVDGRATNHFTCQRLQYENIRGGLDVRNSAAGTTQIKTMWLLLSQGPDGHGAYPPAPSGTATIASRINAGSGMTDADTLTNANVDGSFAAAVDNIFVRKEPTSSFDDILWVSPTHANTCALGRMAARGFPAANLTGSQTNAVASTGDLNGDGYTDVIATESSDAVILFGSAGGFTTLNPPTSGPAAVTPAEVRPEVVRIGGGNGGYATGDFNGDGIDDLAIVPYLANRVYLIYGRRHWTDIANITTAGYDTRLTGFNSGYSRSVALGDLNGDGLAELLFDSSGSATGGRVYVVYGSRTPLPSSIAVNIAGSPSSPRYYHYYAWGVAGFLGESPGRTNTNIKVTDFNGDGYGDIVVFGNKDTIWGTWYHGELFVIYGSATLATDTPVDVTDLTSRTAAEGLRFTSDPALSSGIDSYTTLAVGDLNGDNKGDIALFLAAAQDGTGTITDAPSACGVLYVIYGSDGYASYTHSLATSDVNDGNNKGFSIGRASVGCVGENPIAFADLDADGYDDLYFVGRVLWGRNTAIAPFARILNHGTSIFYPTLTRNTPGMLVSGCSYPLRARRLNGDKYEDLVCYSIGSGRILRALYGRKREYFSATENTAAY